MIEDTSILLLGRKKLSSFLLFCIILLLPFYCEVIHALLSSSNHFIIQSSGRRPNNAKLQGKIIKQQYDGYYLKNQEKINLKSNTLFKNNNNDNHDNDNIHESSFVNCYNNSNRRSFLFISLSTIATTSTITPDEGVVWAVEEEQKIENKDDDDNDREENDPISIITTPSISEGELAVSSPPPNRVKEVPITTTTSTSTTQTSKQKVGPDPRFFIAGGASAAISHGITTPIDVVKTRMQSDTSLANISPLEAAIQISEREGPAAFTAGLGPTVIGYGLEGALKFGVYESLKPIFLSLLGVLEIGSANNSGEAYLAAAVCAGALASVILCPMEETRIRLVTDPTFGKGLFDGLPKLLKEDGVLSPFQRGMPPMLAKQVPYTMGKQVSFDLFAAMLYTFLVGLSFVPQKEIALEVEIGAAFLASIVACLSSHPGDVLLTATYKNNDNSGELNKSTDFISTIRKVYNDGGVSAFFRGLNARFVHVGLIITFQLVIYDQIKQALGLPASGG